ncbi:Conserved_hypothetical protein [Hexamita inflata]|uniref:Uncharacterized protein n=1 Tax=Hexamita inflata TaxID=28002 RepID=A0AA86RD05_9EUKA|nr:Conserved hypothetical protein [Hexamita inflata]CAI9974077.1 Conserved hypothetical protein [Hexamita inflata]
MQARFKQLKITSIAETNRYIEYLNTISQEQQDKFLEMDANERNDILYNFEQEQQFASAKKPQKQRREVSESESISGSSELSINPESESESFKPKEDEISQKFDEDDLAGEPEQLVKLQDVRNRTVNSQEMLILMKSPYFKEVCKFVYVVIEIETDDVQLLNEEQKVKKTRDVLVQVSSRIKLNDAPISCFDVTENATLEISAPSKFMTRKVKLSQILSASCLTDKIFKEFTFNTAFQPQQIDILKAILTQREGPELFHLNSFFDVNTLDQKQYQKCIEQCNVRIQGLKWLQYQRWDQPKVLAHQDLPLDEQLPLFDNDLVDLLQQFQDLKGQMTDMYVNQLRNQVKTQLSNTFMSGTENGQVLMEAVQILKEFKQTAQKKIEIEKKPVNENILETLKIGQKVEIQGNKIVIGAETAPMEKCCYKCEFYGQENVLIGKAIEGFKRIYKFK